MKRHIAGVRAVTGTLLLVGALVGGWGSTRETQAAAASRGDPIFWIDSCAAQSTAHVKLQINVTVNSAVQGVTYAVHAPRGTAVQSMRYTGGTLSGLESYTFVADQETQQYLVVTTVTTQFAVPVTVSVQLVGGSASPAPTLTTGQSNQPISTLVGGSLSVSGC